MAVTKHLIIPGMAKSGTTFLWDQFVSRTEHVNFSTPKEIGYLAVGDDWDKYATNFPNADENKVYLDSTPQYGDSYKAFAENTGSMLKGQEVQIMFCLRDPIARAFSHYRHDLSTHSWTSFMGDYSFLSEGSLRRYVRPYHDIIKTLQNTFGTENVHGFSFKQSTGKLPKSVHKMLGLDGDWELDFNINPALGGGLPRLAYDPDRPTLIAQDGKIYKLPAKTLLVSTTLFSQLYPDYPEDLGRKVLSHAANWTQELDRSVFGSAWKDIQSDYSQSLKALKMSPEELPTEGMIKYKGEMPIRQHILDRLELVDTADDISKKIYKESKAGKPYLSGNEELADIDITLAGQAEKVQRVFKAKGNLAERKFELRRSVEQFGPIGLFLTSYVNLQLALGDSAEAVRILKMHPHAGRYINKNQIKNTINRVKEKLDVDDVAKVAKMISLEL